MLNGQSKCELKDKNKHGVKTPDPGENVDVSDEPCTLLYMYFYVYMSSSFFYGLLNRKYLNASNAF